MSWHMLCRRHYPDDVYMFLDPNGKRPVLSGNAEE